MQNKAYQMRKEIRLISKYKALGLSKNFMSICLVISTIYVSLQRYPVSPLYILFLLHVLPPILSFAIKDYANRYHNKILIYLSKENPFLLSALKRKYHYSRINDSSNTFSFYFTLIMLILWQYNYITMYYIESWHLYIPVIILSVALFIRSIGTIFYQFKLHYDISTNKW